jgi:membrane protease YdiL (CAAX protease family)
MNPFWNSNERRLRSLLRIVLQLILYLLFALGLVFIMSDLLMPLIPPDSPLLVIRFRNNFLLGELTSPLIALGATLLSMFLAAKFLDKRRFRDFGFHREKGWWNDFFFGLGLGAVLMAFIFLVELSLGWIRVIGFFSPRAGNPFWLGILIDLITFICVGIYEEMLLRGYVLRNLAEGMNFKRLKPTTAVLLATFFSSVIFKYSQFYKPADRRDIPEPGVYPHRRTCYPHRAAYRLELFSGSRFWFSGQRSCCDQPGHINRTNPK